MTTPRTRDPGAAPVCTVVVLLAGVVTLAVLRSLPVVGGVVVFASVLFGLGALALWTYRRYERTAKAAQGRSAVQTGS